MYLAICIVFLLFPGLGPFWMRGGVYINMVLCMCVLCVVCCVLCVVCCVLCVVCPMSCVVCRVSCVVCRVSCVVCCVLCVVLCVVHYSRLFGSPFTEVGIPM